MGKRKPLHDKPGRPPVEVDMNLLESLCQIQCTEEECAAVLKVSADTISSRVKALGYTNFSDFLKKHSQEGRASLRRMQWQSAKGIKNDKKEWVERPNVTMQIWLGKQVLGQKDKQEVEQQGAIEVKIVREIKDRESKK